MGNCIYIYKNKQFNSEIELDDFLLNKGDELISKYGDLALQQAHTLEVLDIISKDVEKLKELPKNAKQIYVDGESVLEFNPPYIGVIKFLSGLKNTKDKLLSPEFREFNYWSEKIKMWKDGIFDSDEKLLFGNNIIITDSLNDNDLKSYIDNYNRTEIAPKTDNQILNLIGKIKEKWLVQGKTGTEIHNTLAFLFGKVKNGVNLGKLRLDVEGLTDIILQDKKYLTRNHVENIIEYAKQLKKEIEIKLGDSNLIYFPEFQVSCKLNLYIENKGDTILGIIDLLVIDSKGKAHIIDYKASPKNIFDKAKERSFWYQLGTYHRMMLQYGISFTQDLRVMIAPILMKGFRKEGNSYIMDEIISRGSELLEDITNNSTRHTVARNLDEFIPERLLVNLPPEEIGKKVETFMNINFPDFSINKFDDETIKQMLNKKGGVLFNSKTKKYYIDFGNTTNYTGDSEAEVFDKFVKYYKEILPKKRLDYIDQTITALKKGIETESNDMDLPPVKNVKVDEGASESWLRNLISKYCNSNYEIIDNPAILSYGCVLIKNNKSKEIDVLKITTDNLYESRTLGNGNTLLTGTNIKDRDQVRKSNDMTMSSITGNIHLMETMAILNCMPEINKGGYIIGQVQIINPHNLEGIAPGSNEELLYNFIELSKITNNELEKNQLNKIEINLNKNYFASKVLLLRNRLTHILSMLEEDKYKKFKQFENTLTDLDSAIALYEEDTIINKLTLLLQELEKRFSDKIQIELDGYDEDLNVARSLYEKTILALAELKGFSARLQFKDNASFIEKVNPVKNGVQSLMLDNPGNLNNDTLNYLTKIVTEAYQNVREDVQREMVNIRKLVESLKQAKGFGKLKEMTTGNAAKLFINMIELKNGDLLFKNPWDSTVYMLKEEREFLKYALTIINNNRFKNKDDIEEKRLTGNPAYFRVPLAIGDKASRQAVLGTLNEGLKEKFNRMNPTYWWEEALKKLTGIFTDIKTSNYSKNLFEMNNMFEMGENDVEKRINEIQKRGLEYFEHNLETLLIKHIHTYSTQKHINNVMPLAKASMIHLVAQGNLTNKKYHNATNYVTDYIKNKIKNESLTDPYFRKTEAIVGKVKQAASFLILGFSPVLYVGQIIQSLFIDIRLYLQSINQEDATFTLHNFKEAFKNVYIDMFKLGSKPSKCSLLNEFFGMNDMDMNTYSDKIKSDRYGIYNFTNIAFHCSSRPDFFSRMSLFVAQMIKDGTWEAYSKTLDNALKYDWTRDSRFDAYAKKDKSNLEKYLLQEALYYAIAEQLVKEHAMNEDGSIFKIGDDLPKAYTNLQIESFKSLSDDIYGYYTHEKKSMVHALTWGALWMQMRTFWSGKKNQYFGTAGVKLQGKYVHQKNSDGELLYYQIENDRRIITTNNTGIPVMKWEGLWQEGIIISLATLFSDIKNGEISWEDFWHDPKYAIIRSNLILFTYDLTMFMWLGPMLASMMADWSDELGKDAKQSGDVMDGLLASAGNIAIKSVNYGFLDFNFIESIGSPMTDWRPISFNYMTRRLSDIVDVSLGEKSFKNAILNTSTFTSITKPFWNNLLFNN